MLAFCLAAPGYAQAEEPIPLAVFDLAFINYSQEVEFGVKNEAEIARARMASNYLRELLAKEPRFSLLSSDPIMDDLRAAGDVFTCNGCEEKLARKIGAERSITGAVQKLSVLVQTIVLRERDARTGAVIALYQTDIRGNTDIAWKRGVAFLVENRIRRQKQ